MDLFKTPVCQEFVFWPLRILVIKCAQVDRYYFAGYGCHLYRYWLYCFSLREPSAVANTSSSHLRCLPSRSPSRDFTRSSQLIIYLRTCDPTCCYLVEQNDASMDQLLVYGLLEQHHFFGSHPLFLYHSYSCPVFWASQKIYGLRDFAKTPITTKLQSHHLHRFLNIFFSQCSFGYSRAN